MKINLKIIVLSFFFLFSIQLNSKVIYVNGNLVTGNNNGISWEDAYSNFQDAIADAVYGDSIWVAQGTYYPTSDFNQEISFELKNGVKWFGGFQGMETTFGQRDLDLYLTRLSGDIGIQGDSTDNSYHVVYTIGSDSTTVIDGFLISEGRAIDSVFIMGNHRQFGGGLLIDATEMDSIAVPKIVNCSFQNNIALYGGGISFGKGFNNFHINPNISNCHFYQNKGTITGGAINVLGGSLTIESTITIEDCEFEENGANSNGGAIYLREVTNDFKFINCDFIANYTFGTNAQGNPNGLGGAISYEVDNFNNVIKLSFFNCDFINNFAKKGGGIHIYIPNVYIEDLLELEIENSLFSNNFVTSGNFDGGSIDYNTKIQQQKITIKKSKFINHISNSFFAPDYVIRIRTSASIAPVNENLDLKILDCEFFQNEPSCINLNQSFQSLKNKFILANTTFRDNYSNEGIIDIVHGTLAPSVDAEILNCTFFNNNSITNIFFSDTSSSLNIANSIFWEDLTPSEMFIGNIEGFNIHHSLLKSPDCLVDGIDYCNDGMLFNIYPEFRDTFNNDFSLRSCSPAINQGDDLSIDTVGIFFDKDGNPRKLDGAVDLGAYETQDFEVLVPQVEHVKCFDGADGAITWVQHGTPDFDFEWDNGVSTGTVFTGLSAGNYSIAVIDGDNCQDTFNMIVNQPLSLEIMDTIITAASGSMNADGWIEVMISGGTPDYQHLWSNGDTTALTENLLPGVYSVTITDANGCIEILETEVSFMTAINNLDKKYSVNLIPNLIQKGTPINLIFDLEKNASFEIEIFNKIGQVLFSKKIKLVKGKQKYELPILKEQGLFFVKIKNNSGAGQILKLVVL